MKMRSIAVVLIPMLGASFVPWLAAPSQTTDGRRDKPPVAPPPVVEPAKGKSLDGELRAIMRDVDALRKDAEDQLKRLTELKDQGGFDKPDKAIKNLAQIKQVMRQVRDLGARLVDAQNKFDATAQEAIAQSRRVGPVGRKVIEGLEQKLVEIPESKSLKATIDLYKRYVDTYTKYADDLSKGREIAAEGVTEIRKEVRGLEISLQALDNLPDELPTDDVAEYAKQIQEFHKLFDKMLKDLSEISSNFGSPSSQQPMPPAKAAS